MAATLKITSKGQITLPRKVREAINSDTVEIMMEGDKIVLLPVRSVAGALSKYAGSPALLAEIRNKVWEEVANAKK